MNPMNRLFSLAVALALVSGCASNPADGKGAGISHTDELVDADTLYAGQPDVVFATEFPVASAEEAIQRGDRAYLNGETDLALYLYVRAYALEKDNLHALGGIANIHEARGSTELATRAYLAMLKVDSSNADALQALGLLYLQSQSYAEAELLLERAIAEDPSRWRAHNGLGVIADMRGEHGHAIMSYDLALEANPDDATLLNNRGYSYYLVGAYRRAADDFQRAGAKGSRRARINMGLVLARQGQYSQAVQAMRGTIDVEVAYNDVGYIAMRQGDLDTAATYFQKAINLSPRYFEAAAANLVELRRLARERPGPTGVAAAFDESG